MSTSTGHRPARCLMVLGCTSNAGKSWLTTALCRWYANQGLRVAPFKAQNMSNNARVVGGTAQHPDGGEIGSAQYFQALAARTQPDVRMNPLLLKPEADTRSQVVLLGQVHPELTAMAWRERPRHTWPAVAEALDALRASHDLVLIEGAGSPAEINLYASDVVNMRVARHAQARCLLVADIDRGGAFAHLYGTWALLPESDRALIRGFVLNKFRGDARLLAPAPEMLRERTGVPTLATLPLWRGHGLPEEDGVFDDAGVGQAQGEATRIIAIVAYPHLSNLDEFEPLRQLAALPGSGVRLRWVRDPAALGDLQPHDTLILPGSKHTAADLQWLRERRLDAAICAHAARGGRVLGICGGLQMLGEAVIDTDGLEGGPGARHANAPGLGLLPLVTLFTARKTVRHWSGAFGTRPTEGASSEAPAWPGAWSALAGQPLSGYEIHMGQTAPHPAMLRAGHRAMPVLASAADGAAPLGWINGAATAANPHVGNVLGLYLHGMLEHPHILQALWGAAPPPLEETFERMAAFVETHFGAETLHALVQP